MRTTARRRRARRPGKRNDTALVLMLVVGLVAALFHFDVLNTPEPLHAADVTGCDAASVHLSGVQAELLRLHNEARQEHGLGAFCVSERLTRVATAHSRDMLNRSYYDHVSPEGGTPAQRVEAAGYAYSMMAENIHKRSLPYALEPSQEDLEQVFEDWMDSPGHRANLLNQNLREVGIGAAFGRYDMESATTGLYTVDFGTPR